jgi:predicted nuclease with TOPRIM domain
MFEKEADNASDVFNAQEKRIAELEKENAELKDKNKALEQYADLADEKVDEIKGHLTEAKELLSEWVELFKPKYISVPPFPIQIKTEQFLKEISE